MTNLEWLRTLDVDDFTRLLRHVGCTSACQLCNLCTYELESFECKTRPCLEGIREWLEAEHVEPDTWERIGEDARKLGRYGHFRCDLDEPEECATCLIQGICRERQALELVRRCKALAGVADD